LVVLRTRRRTFPVSGHPNPASRPAAAAGRYRLIHAEGKPAAHVGGDASVLCVQVINLDENFYGFLF
jgi:hypothetical protein